MASRLCWKAKSRNAAHNSSAMLPVAVPACLQYLPFPTLELGGWRILHRCNKGEDVLQKTLLQAEQSKEQLSAEAAADQPAAAAQGPPVSLPDCSQQ